MKIIPIFMITFIFTTPLWAQFVVRKSPALLSIKTKDTQKEIAPLSIGDQVPDIIFENVLNYKKRKVKLSDFKGKLIILDMWSTWCTSCIAAFPKMEKLQSHFKDKLQILLVNPHSVVYDSEQKIISTLDKNKIRTGFYPSLPIPIHDSILNTYFPHQSVPHQVWIDGNGKVVAITGSLEVTEENIQRILNGKNIKIPIKNDWAFDKQKPLLIENNGGTGVDIVYRSVFTNYKGGIGFSSGVRLDTNNKVIGIYMLNKTLWQFVMEAFSELLDNYSYNRIMLDVVDSTKFSQEINSNSAYCYDLILPSTAFQSAGINELLKEDLKRVFNISIEKVRRKINCLVIKSTDKVSSSYTKFNKKSLDLGASSIKKFIRNYPVKQVIIFFDRFNTPLIDETGISEVSIDIELPENANLSNINEIATVLRQAGFDLKYENREIEVILLSDK